MPIDPNVFANIKTFGDYQKADQAFQLQKALQTQQLQTGGIDAASKANVYKTQLLSGAAAGGQPAYDQARQTLQQQGIDTSEYAPDVQTAMQQLQSARLAQSPLGALLNAGTKIDANNIAAAGVTGQIDGGAKFGLPQGSGLAGLITGNINPMLPKLIQTESGGNPNAVSPAGAQGVAQIMPATASDPGYGVKPLQNWDGTNPASAPVPEQMRFANDYLNAMQTHNGGNPQLGAAAYNAGPGRVDAALSQLPQETQNYVSKVAPKFNPPAQGPNETLPAYKDRVQQAFEIYKSDPRYLAAASSAGETGKLGAENTNAASKAAELTDRLKQNLQAMLRLNPDVPSGGLIPASAKAYLSQAGAANGIGEGKGAIAADQWDQINNQQIISEIQQFVASGGANTRINQTLDKMIRAASGIDKNSLPKSREAQIRNALAEIENKNVSAGNIAGGNEPYASIPVVTSSSPQQSSDIPPGGVLYGTSKGKPVYKMPDGSFVMSQ